MRQLLLLAAAAALAGGPVYAASPPSGAARFSGSGALHASANNDSNARYRMEAQLQRPGTTTPQRVADAKQFAPALASPTAKSTGSRFALSAALRDSHAPNGGATCGTVGVDIFKNGFE